MAPSPSREELVRLAKLAEQGGRFEDMVNTMNRLVILKGDLTVEERNLLSTGYLKLITSKGASLNYTRAQGLDLKEPQDIDLRLAGEAYMKAEEELNKLCSNSVKIIDDHLLLTATTAESSVFYNKMKGDIYQQLASFNLGTAKLEVIDEALNAYQIAAKTAEKSLRPTNSVRLQLALNMSSFYNDVLKSADRAYEIAKEAFDEANSDMFCLGEDDLKDCIPLMQCMKDRLKDWNPKVAATEVAVRRQSRQVRPKLSSENDSSRKVIYMSGPMPGKSSFPHDHSEGLPPEPSYSSDAHEDKVSSEKQLVLQKLGMEDDHRLKSKLRGQLSFLSRIGGSSLGPRVAMAPPSFCKITYKSFILLCK